MLKDKGKKNNFIFKKIFINLGRNGLLAWMSDERYLKILYYSQFKEKLNLSNPKSFCEKLQWLKLYDRNPLYSTLVDKFEAKKYVSSILGPKYIIPTIGIWDSFKEINFDKLPNQFVLKCTHNSGEVVLCQDKKNIDIPQICKKLEKCMRQNYYYLGREWPYKVIKPRIIAEEYLKDSKHSDLIDYKFYCFGGVPKFCQVVSNRLSDKTIDFFDMEWNWQDFTGLTDQAKKSAVAPAKPDKFEEMKDIICQLGLDNSFSRIDLYEVKGKVYFGEFTFYPNSGIGSFRPQTWNKTMGDLIKL